MHVKHLNLVNFRNYASVDIKFARGINILVGRNGQGKTNLVEAINYLATLSSHRVSGYLPLIKKNSSQALIRLLASFADRENLIELELNVEESNRARINKSSVSRVRDILGYLQSVIFSPEDIAIVKGDPSNRRDFLDQLLIQFSPRLAGVLSDYDRVLRQRNTLLKTSRNLPKESAGLSTLDAWDEQLVELGSEIILQRIMLVNELLPHLDVAYKMIAEEKNDPSMVIKTSVLGNNIDDEIEVANFDKQAIIESFRNKLASSRPKELERGVSLIGPHRDDLYLTLGELPAKGFISHGETWSFALALKLASANLLRNESVAGDPVLILDDVFAELDSVRRARLIDLIASYEQVIITAAVSEDIPAGINATMFSIRDGKVVDHDG